MVEIIDEATFESIKDEVEVDFGFPAQYTAFQRSEGIPVHTGFVIEDVNAVEVGDWDRTGQRGAFVNLYGQEGANDMHVHEIAGAERTTRQRHLYEEIVYVSQGRGATLIETGDEEISIEWQRHSMFVLPPNTPYRHVNLAANQPARLVSQTTLPRLCVLFDTTFIFDSEYDFGREGDYDYDLYSEGTLYEGSRNPFWETYFVPDLLAFDELVEKPSRGAGSNIHFVMTGTSQLAHASEFPPGQHNKPHRHQPGANIILLSGHGYSLLWPPAWEKSEFQDTYVRIDWQPGSLATPPALWWHQHFNTSDEPVRYFAMRAAPLGALGESIFNARKREHNIEYVEQPPAIREQYERELADRGLESTMPDAAYTDPDFFEVDYTQFKRDDLDDDAMRS